MNDELLTDNEAQGYLKVSRSTLSRWEREGKLKVYRVGRQRRYRRKDIDALIVPSQAQQKAATEALAGLPKERRKL